MRREVMNRDGMRWCHVAAVALLLLVGAGGGGALAEERAEAPADALSVEVPEIITIAPSWGPSGWVFSLTIQGRNLTGASEVKFLPSTGIVIEDQPVVNSEGTVATVKVTLLVHAPLGPRLVVVRTPRGQSSLTPTEANTFKVSFAHLH